MLKNEHRLPLLLGAAGLLLMARLVLMPLLAWQNDLADENGRLARQLAKAEQRIEMAPAMEARTAQLEALLSESEERLAQGEARSSLAQQRALETLFEEAELTLRSFNWALEETLDEGHGRLRAEANLAGSLPAFIGGAYALSARTPHTEIVSLDLRLNRREQQLTGRGLNGTIIFDVITDGAPRPAVGGAQE
jgi:hypothetical protein